MRTLGLDVGDRRIGVAISDPDGRLAFPGRVVERRGPGDFRAIADLAAREEAGRIVVGLPVSLSGEVGDQARSVELFVESLRQATDLEVILYDERLSSVEADRLLQAGGASGRQARERRDSVAASIILQAYLDSRAFEEDA